MAAKRSITNFEAVLQFYKTSFKTNPCWFLFDGMSEKGVRMDTNLSIIEGPNPNISDVEEDEDYIESVQRLESVVSRYEAGLFTIYFKTSATQKFVDGYSHTFKVGEENSGSDDIFGGIAGFSGSKNKGSNPFQNFFMASAIKGMESGKSTEMARLELEIEKLKLERRHEKELEDLQNSPTNRIMGFIEDNPDRVFDIVENIAPMIGFAFKGKKRVTNTPINDSYEETERTETVSGQTPAMADNYVSVDHFVNLVKPFMKSTGISPNVALEKIKLFAELDPNSFAMAMNMIDAKIQEANGTEDEKYD
jgi:hypothetical protein